MERKLASIQRVNAILPIDGSDFIELARIEGWQCVVKKGEFEIGSLGVFFEIDSVMPQVPWTEFLAHRGYRIKTMKLRGALSQGLFLPIDILGEGDWPEDTDVTENLGVLKYEPVMKGCAGFGIKGIDPDHRAEFPAFISKTDETRIQSAVACLDELRGKAFVATVKVDGSSVTYCMMDGEFHACTRNQSVIDRPGIKVWEIAHKYGICTMLAENPSLVIQGEMYGPGIQKNKLGVPDTSLAVFNIFDVAQARYFGYAELWDWCAMYELPVVETAFDGDSFDMTLDQLLAAAEGKHPNGAEREGIVIRPQVECHSYKLNGRLSFKVISNRFLLKGGDE